MAIAAAVAGFIKAYYPDFPDKALYGIVAACLGYAAIEGGVDAVYALAKWWVEKKQEKCQSCLDDEAVQEQIAKGR